MSRARRRKPRPAAAREPRAGASAARERPAGAGHDRPAGAARDRPAAAGAPSGRRARAAPRTAPTHRGPRSARGERPHAPWHPFPLVELCVLVGLVLLVWGAVTAGTDRGRVMLAFGLVLGSLGGLDTALREHFAGYRSHTTVLAGVPAVLVAAVAFFVGVPWIAIVAAAAIAFAAAFWWLRRTYRR